MGYMCDKHSQAFTDMLAALESAVRELESYIHDSYDGTISLDDHLETVKPFRAAIEKARRRLGNELHTS